MKPPRTYKEHKEQWEKKRKGFMGTTLAEREAAARARAAAAAADSKARGDRAKAEIQESRQRRVDAAKMAEKGIKHYWRTGKKPN